MEQRWEYQAMSWIKEAVEGSYTNFKLDFGITGIDIMNIGFYIIVAFFIFGAIYTVMRTMQAITITRGTFLQKNFLVGSGFFALAVFNAWFTWWLLIFFDVFIIPTTGYVLSIVWLIPGIAGLCYFEQWKRSNLRYSGALTK